MDGLEVIGYWIFYGVFVYTFPPFMVLSAVLLDKVKNISVFKNRSSAILALLVSLPCSFFTFEMFYDGMAKLSIIRYYALEWKLYNIFDISILNYKLYAKLSVIFFILCIVYNIAAAMRSGASLPRKIAAAVIRTQMSLTVTFCGINLIYMITLIPYYDDTDKYILIFWAASFSFAVLIFRRCFDKVRLKKQASE